jgi:hypothetical protein
MPTTFFFCFSQNSYGMAVINLGIPSVRKWNGLMQGLTVACIRISISGGEAPPSASTTAVAL